MANKATFKDVLNALECLSGKDVYCSTCFYNGMPKCREKVAQDASKMMLKMANKQNNKSTKPKKKKIF